MEKKKLLYKLISIGTLIGLTALVIVSGVVLWQVFRQHTNLPEGISKVPVVDVKRYNDLWEKVSQRQIFGSSPAANIDYSTMLFGRTDPFHP